MKDLLSSSKRLPYVVGKSTLEKFKN